MTARASKALIVLVVASLVLTATIGNYFLHQRVLDRVELFDGILTNQGKEIDLSKISSTWVSDKVTHKVTTYKKEDESNSEWLARHNAELAAARAQYPPD